MTSGRLLDYSAGKPGAGNIKAAGFAGAIRYVGLPGYTKNTDRAEFLDFQLHGLEMGFVFEWHADDWRGGYDAGMRYYRQARDHVDALGGDPESTIYMAVDQDVVTPVEFQAAVNYIAGAIDAADGVETRVGTYGEHDVVRVVRARFPNTKSWQCRAWSGTPARLYPGRHLYQHVGLTVVGGIQCDFNDVLTDDWGQHTRVSPGTGPSTNPTPWWHHREDDDMANAVTLEIIPTLDGSTDELLPVGFGIFIDLTNRISTGGVGANMRASAAQAHTYHQGVTPDEARDWLSKYDAPIPEVNANVRVLIEKAVAADAAATAVAADQRA